MNSLSETKTYNNIEKTFGIKGKGLTNTIIELDLNKYTVPEDLYMEYVYQFKGYRYPLAKLTYENCRNQMVFPILLADPVDKEGVQSMENYIPQSIMTFLKPTNTSSKVLSYVDCSIKGGYSREKLKNEPILFKIKTVQLYAFMQFATVRRYTYLNDDKISKATTLLNNLANFYSNLVSKIIDKIYAISADYDDFIILKFLCNCFFLEAMAKMPKEKAINMTLSNPYYNKFNSMILARCEYVSTSNPLNMGNADKVTEYPIDVFAKVCQEQFKQMEDKFNVRLYTYEFLKLYSQNASFVLEDFNSFLIMLQSGYLKLGLFNDLTVSNTLGTKLGDVLRDLELLFYKS